MKKIMKTLALVAVAAMGLTACQNEYDDEQIVVNDSVVVTFVADAADDTRTSVDTSGEKPAFAWGENETFAVLEQTDALAEATSVTFTKEDGKAKIEAEFATNAGKGSYDYVTVYPESGYKTGATSINEATLSLPAAQTMAEGSYDPAADLMVSEVVTTTAQPTEAQMVGFTRLAAVAKMTLKNFSLEDGDEVESVTFTAEGKVLAGTFTTDLAAPAVAEAEGSNSVTVATTSSDVVYFTVLPTTIDAGDSFTVTVVTNRRVYIREVTIPEGKPLTFQAGNVTLFGVNMQSAVSYEKWTLVTDASTLEDKDIVTIVANNYNYVVGKQGNNYPIASYTEIVKGDNYFYHPVASNATADHTMQRYTLVKRDGGFDFYNGVDYEGDTNKGFVWAAGSNNSPKLQAYSNNDTWFSVNITDGIATIKAEKIEKSYKWWRYSHSASYASSRKFDMTTSEPTNNYKICLYKLEGVKGDVPVIAANVTVSGDVVITEDGAAEATPIQEVVFDYVGDWTITASATEKDSEEPATWLTLAYDEENNWLTYTAEKNNDAKREATITITASLEGQKDLTWTVNVTQKGAPLDITIEEFGKLAADPNQTYRLTGKVTKLAENNNTKGYTLEDENQNQAFINYLKTEANESVWGHDDIELQLGDIVTVTAVPTGSKKGGSSTNPAIYKGHYRLTATAVTAADYTGGDVTINVEVVKNGNIDAPTAISDSEVEIDSNIITNYSFTDNGDGTATAVLSFGLNETSGMREAKLTFAAGSPLVTKYTVVASQDVNPALKKGWWLVTDVNDLKAGDKLIIAATGLDYAISTETNTNTRKSKPITKNGASLEDVADNIQQYALEIDANGLYSFKGTLGTDADKYIYASSSSSNYMKVTSTLDDNGKWTIAIASDGAATVIAQGSNTRNHMQYNNKVTSSPAFNCTADGSLGAVCFYKFYE